MALMTIRETDEVLRMATREDVRFALVHEHAGNLYWIALTFRTDEYSVLEMASSIKDRWERVADKMNDNKALSHQDYTELMTVIIECMRQEFFVLGYSRKEFLDICSELQ